MVAGLGLYGLTPAMRMAANFSSLGTSPFSFPNLANSASLASTGGNAQTAEDAMAKLWSPFFNTAASSTANQLQTNAQPTTTTNSTTSSSNNSSTSSNNSTTSTVSNANLNNLSNIVTSSAAAASLAAASSPFNSAFNPLFPPLAGFQPFDITQAMRLSAQPNNATSSGNQNASSGTANNSASLDTRSILNAYINDLNNGGDQSQQISNNHTTTASPSTTTSISSALNGLTNNNNSLSNNQFNFNLFTAERYKAAAACFNHRFFPYNFSKPFFGNQQNNSQCNSTTNSTNPTTNSSSSSVNSNGTASANQALKNTFGAFSNFNLNNSFGLSSAFPGLNLNNLNSLSNNLFNQNSSLANLTAPMNTSLTSSTTSTAGLTTNSPLTPRAPSTPLSASSLSECNVNSLLNGSNSNQINNSTGGSIGGSSPRLTNCSNGVNSSNSSSNSNKDSLRRSSAGKESLPSDEELLDNCDSNKLNSDGKQTPEQMQLKSMERMVECLNQASNQSNGDLNSNNVHLTSNKLNASNAAVPTAT